MKKKFFLASYVFKTGGVVYTGSLLMSIKFDSKSSPSKEDFTECAYHDFKAWFAGQYPESELTHVIIPETRECNLSDVRVIKGPITTTEELRSMRVHEIDGYDSNSLNVGQIEELIRTHAKYTDFIVLKGELEPKKVYVLENQGMYVNYITDASIDQHFTLIKWDGK